MNTTPLEHLIIALLIQLGFWRFTGSWWLGAVFSIGLFLGREHAQREYKIGNPSQLWGYEALDFWRWKLDALLDLLLPAIAVLLVAWLLG